MWGGMDGTICDRHEEVGDKDGGGVLNLLSCCLEIFPLHLTVRVFMV